MGPTFDTLAFNRLSNSWANGGDKLRYLAATLNKIVVIEEYSRTSEFSNCKIPAVSVFSIIETCSSRPRNIKDEAYTPQLISIGPFHHGAIELDIDFVKLPYPLLQELYDFANPIYSSSNPGKNVQEKEEADDLQHCLSCFQPCFPFSRSTPSDDHRIETEQTETAYDHPFLKLTCEFFKEYTKLQPIENGVQVKQFTDLVRYFLWPIEKMTWVGNGDCIPTKSIYNVRKLKEARVKFRPNEGTERFVTKRGEDHKCNFKMACFRNMNLKLTKFWASYFLMLDQLVDTVEDVNVLIKSEVIVNLLCSSDAVAKLINSLCGQIMDSRSCYTDICQQLNEHYEISFCNRNISILKRVYFKDLWTGSSTILGLFVLVFSIIGTMKSLMSYLIGF
ncbi:unnamed protein product [Prunus armeniaca]